MRLPLQISPSFTSQLPLSSTSSSDPPLVFIDSEPFIVELQGKLDLPEGEAEPDTYSGGGADEAGRLRGSRVGRIDLSDPKKPTMRIAHHRLEGKLETLLTPYALLRTSRRRRRDSTTQENEAEGDETDSERLSKRARIGQGEESMSNTGGGGRNKIKAQQDNNEPEEEGEEGSTTEIEIVGIIRKKIVFNKRPEPLIEISSEADPTMNVDGRKEKEAKRGPKGLLSFGGGKR
ncbi:uncharacterized protein JCM6883_004608 [Sporobolomyces salmoneus]|uniref:uncharacterized protein n=1 Tax=Sporobolomyces salmoneus TaxID=183962 RepID=UPI0031807ECF